MNIKLKNEDYLMITNKKYCDFIQDKKDYIPSDVKDFMYNTQTKYIKLINQYNVLDNGPIISLTLYTNIKLCLDVLYYLNNTLVSVLQSCLKENLNRRLKNHGLSCLT
jgi:hypothetical protein